MTDLSPAKIMQLGTGFFGSRVLLSAVELDVFSSLAECPLSLTDLQHRLGLHPRSAADFLDALVSLGLLDRQGDGPGAVYANTAESALFLVSSSPEFRGGILKMAGRRLYRDWAALTEKLRNGNMGSDGASDAFAKLYADLEGQQEFMDAMRSVQRRNFELFADRFDFSPYRSVCDVGGADASLSIAIARRWPHLRCTSFDLPAVTEIATKRIAAENCSDRVRAVAGDFSRQALPVAEVILMGNVLHDWDFETKLSLIGKAFEALPDAGALVVIEDVIDDARRENAQGLLMSLNMLIETPGGYNFSFAQFTNWTLGAGFARTERIELEGSSAALIAYR
ncbi:acetylserotonin O-methyltransferase [Sphingobium sp. PNB]|uniref:methyltransferase n=1 Tax=Sphingobium sp. PNB TaxID=863934 RepID=UPI001CA45852|nr:methyltransferase [Sphingobium sp. PNB]MCB4858442.1 acetylserotonin O-methyltransferase [Sphingobium sp. PNB]